MTKRAFGVAGLALLGAALWLGCAPRPRAGQRRCQRAGAARARRARSALRRPRMGLRPHPLHGVDAAAAPRPQPVRRAVVHRRARRPNGTSRAASAPRPRSRSTIRSTSRSRIRSSSAIPGSTSWKAGNLRLKDAEVPILREYLLRGGTLTFDDFHGPIEWANVESELKRVFPDRKIVDLPKDHPIFSCFYKMDGFPQTPGPRLVPAGAHLGKGGLRRAPARHRGRHTAARWC